MATTTSRPMGTVKAICVASAAIGWPRGKEAGRPVIRTVSQVSGKISVPPRKSTATETGAEIHVAATTAESHTAADTS